MSSLNELSTQGFDAAVAKRQQDHLNRWPLAREIYGIATTEALRTFSHGDFSPN
jgi:hypothetical protein